MTEYAQSDSGAERLELNRSARGAYYWKLVVVGPIDEAAKRAIEVDAIIERHYGPRASPEPERDTAEP